MLFDHARDGGPKGAFLVRPDPDEKPVRRLDTGGECGADARARADADAAREHGGGMAYAGCSSCQQCSSSWKRSRIHTELKFSGPYSFRWVGDEVLGEIALHAADHVVVC